MAEEVVATAVEARMNSGVAKISEESGVEFDVEGKTVDILELSRLRVEGQRLKLESENAQLRASLRNLMLPWWRKGSIVATLTALVAAIVPITTAVQAHYEKERALALQESKQANDIRVSFLDRIEKPESRLRTLRFLMETTEDTSLRNWASKEIKEVEAQLEEIRKAITTHPDEDPTKIRRDMELRNLPLPNGYPYKIRTEESLKAVADPTLRGTPAEMLNSAEDKETRMNNTTRDWNKIVDELEHGHLQGARDKLREFEDKYGQTDETRELGSQLYALGPDALGSNVRRSQRHE